MYPKRYKAVAADHLPLAGSINDKDERFLPLRDCFYIHLNDAEKSLHLEKFSYYIIADLIPRTPNQKFLITAKMPKNEIYLIDDFAGTATRIIGKISQKDLSADSVNEMNKKRRKVLIKDTASIDGTTAKKYFIVQCPLCKGSKSICCSYTCIFCSGKGTKTYVETTRGPTTQREGQRGYYQYKRYYEGACDYCKGSLLMNECFRCYFCEGNGYLVVKRR